MRFFGLGPRLARLVRGSFGAAAVLAVIATPVAAHTPTAGAAALYGNSPVVTLNFKFAGSYPDWFDGATGGARTALEVDFSDRSFNNSRLPVFAYAAAGSGQVIYSTAGNSPCSGSNTSWIACASGGGTGTWRIYVRDFANSGKTGWHWYQSTGSCVSGKTCFDARRAILHEALHVTMGIGGHDESGQANTIMSSVTPWSPNAGWNTHHIQRCDEAAAQLLYDVSSSAGVFADCFDAIADHGVNGLKSNATVASTYYYGCVGIGETVTGRLEIKDLPGYKLIGGNPLTGRTLNIYRRLSGSTTWSFYSSTIPTNASGYNWSKSIGGSAGTYEYQLRYAGEAGVDASNQPIFTISWRTAPCPI
jgi:hypothetical protein